MILAFVIDDSVVNWIIGTIAASLPVVGTTIVLLWRKFIAFAKPLIESFFASHNKAFAAQTELANEMKVQVPIVSETLKKLGETQDRQCETLDAHGKRLDKHQMTMEEILAEVRKSNPDQSNGLK